LSYVVSGANVVANGGSGLIIDYSISVPNSQSSFSLYDGDSWTFDLFQIWTSETDVGSDDTAKKGISATVYFSDPVTSATVGGFTFGGSILWGMTQWGEVVWKNPAPTFTAADGRVFSIDLSDEVFNLGLFGLNEGAAYGATVKATVKQIGSNYTSVPDNGSTAMLLGLSLLVIAAVSRRRVAF
jgi:hypothetical protein